MGVFLRMSAQVFFSTLRVTGVVLRGWPSALDNFDGEAVRCGDSASESEADKRSGLTGPDLRLVRLGASRACIFRAVNGSLGFAFDPYMARSATAFLGEIFGIFSSALGVLNKAAFEIFFCLPLIFGETLVPFAKLAPFLTLVGVVSDPCIFAEETLEGADLRLDLPASSDGSEPPDKDFDLFLL